MKRKPSTSPASESPCYRWKESNLHSDPCPKSALFREGLLLFDRSPSPLAWVAAEIESPITTNDEGDSEEENTCAGCEVDEWCPWLHLKSCY